MSTHSWNPDPVEQRPVPGNILPADNVGEAFELRDAARRGVFGFDSRDRRSRPFNLLRSQVLKIAKARGWKVIGVTSATPGVGKTFVCTNLAAALSRIPRQRTLLFDLDLRRGSVAQRFGLPEGPSIDAYLAGQISSLDATAQNMEDSGLTIFPSYPTNHSSAELLAGSRMKMLVQAMRSLDEHYICLCDLPPAFANDDASIVLQEIDAYLLVVEEGKTTARQIRDTVEALRPAPCMGTVLNRYRNALGSDDYGFGYATQRSYDAYYT